MGKGYLKVDVCTAGHALLVPGATVLVQDVRGNLLHKLVIDENSVGEKMTLETPPAARSLDPNELRRCFEPYNVEVIPPVGFIPVIVRGVQVFDGQTSILPVKLQPKTNEAEIPEINEFNIPWEHGANMPKNQLWNFDEQLHHIQTMQSILANEVKIPNYISVHLGVPNASASVVRVPFVDYIKNVASSEIFPTWHTSAMYANIYAQISFALNRIFTAWYRSRGFNFDITNSTQFDQFYVHGRNIFENMSNIVDEIFNNFIRRQGRREPFISSYCNGTTSTCPGMSQWGSQSLATQGYTAIQILRYYYPDDIQVVESTNFADQMGTYPGTALSEGSSGADVRTMQLYLNRISGNFWIPAIPNPNGFFGPETTETVKAFERLQNLTVDGIIGRATWYSITRIYVAVRNLAELNSEGQWLGLGEAPPTETLREGARGENVAKVQFLLAYIAEFYDDIPAVVQDGVYRGTTIEAVEAFQRRFGLTVDGVTGPRTWDVLYDVFRSARGVVAQPETPAAPPAPQEPEAVTPAFPGTLLRQGSRGDDVRLMQSYLRAIAAAYPSVPTLNADGVFGPITDGVVRAFQREFGLAVDGIIGPITWAKVVSVYNSLPQTEVPPFPGINLQMGSQGQDVSLMQRYLNDIARLFPIINSLTTDGIFGALTQRSVIQFQSLFGLVTDGIIGPITWGKIASVRGQLSGLSAPGYPGNLIRVGSRGSDVMVVQRYLNAIARRYPSIPHLNVDGIFGPITQGAVTAFQGLFGLTTDGIVGPITWAHLVSVYNMLQIGSVRVSATSVPENMAEARQEASSHNNPPLDRYALLLAATMFKNL